MLLDMQELFQDAAQVSPVMFLLDFSQADFPGYRVETPCEGTITAQDGCGALRFTLRGKATLSSECARCLTPVKEEVSFERSMLLRREDYRVSDEDLPILPDGSLDVTELVYTEILLAAPSLMLCDPQCKGICPICGKERSLGCTCEETVVDDRLSILKQLL